MAVFTRFEITLQEPLMEIEMIAVQMAAENKKWNINMIGFPARILVIEGPKTVKPILKFMGYLGLSADVGLIKKIEEYDPDEFQKEFVDVKPIDPTDFLGDLD